MSKMDYFGSKAPKWPSDGTLPLDPLALGSWGLRPQDPVRVK